MVVEYDKSVQEDRARLGEAAASAKEIEDRALAEKTEASKVIADLRAELETAKFKCSDAERRNSELASAKVRDGAKIAELSRSLRAADHLLETQVAQAVILAKQEVEQMFQDKIASAMKRVELLEGGVKDDMLDLACIEANIELIDIFTGESPPSFAEEKAKMGPRLLKYVGAYERFDEAISGIRSELTIPPLKKDLFTEIHDREPVELSAARAGVRDLSGSNLDLVTSSPLGLIDSAASALPMDVGERVALVLAAPVVEPETGHVRATEVPRCSAETVPPRREGDAPDSSAKKIDAIEELEEKSGAKVPGGEDVV